MILLLSVTEVITRVGHVTNNGGVNSVGGDFGGDSGTTFVELAVFELVFQVVLTSSK